MPVVVFVLDTSGSMNQRAATGVTLLDLAKGAISQLVRLRRRDAKNDRFLLVTFAEGQAAVKLGWRHGHLDILTELKDLTARDLSTPGESLRTAFEHLNLFRLPSGIENYGLGRNPWYGSGMVRWCAGPRQPAAARFIEPAAVVVLTDGGSPISLAGSAGADAVSYRSPFFVCVCGRGLTRRGRAHRPACSAPPGRRPAS